MLLNDYIIKYIRHPKTRATLSIVIIDNYMTAGIEEVGIPPKIPFKGKFPEETADKKTIDRYLIKLAELLARLRAIVPTWYTRDTQDSDYGYSITIVEEPNRAITQLRNLARGRKRWRS